MKKLIFFVFILCSKILFSQVESKEMFLNQVYKDFIPENHQFFYLKEPFIPKTPSSDFLLGELTLSQIDDYKKIIFGGEGMKFIEKYLNNLMALSQSIICVPKPLTKQSVLVESEL